MSQRNLDPKETWVYVPQPTHLYFWLLSVFLRVDWKRLLKWRVSAKLWGNTRRKTEPIVLYSQFSPLPTRKPALTLYLVLYSIFPGCIVFWASVFLRLCGFPVLIQEGYLWTTDYNLNKNNEPCPTQLWRQHYSTPWWGIKHIDCF